jgi:hypothetical protein
MKSTEEKIVKTTRFNRTSTLLFAALLAAGCATQPSGPADAETALRDANRAAMAWTGDHDYHRAVEGLEDVLDDYSGDSTDQSVLTALAMVHLQYGNHEAFLDTADRLRSKISPREYVPLQTQHVLLTSAAMKGWSAHSLPGRGYDSSHDRTVRKLLGVSN